MPTAKFSFRPYLRLGMNATANPNPDDTHARTTVRLQFEGGLERQTGIGLLGPGEINGISPGEIHKIYPQRQAVNVEPNYFPYVEFSQTDFPWRYTPEAPSENRLRPWIVLLTLTDDEFTLHPADYRNGVGAFIELNETGALPDLEQSWAWAHVQILSEESDEPLKDILEMGPQRIISRLMCPRRLQTNQKYHLFLVPAFERGRLKGRGLLKRQSLPVNAQLPAWTSNTGPIQLPFYYQSSFTTSAIGGDFETLVKKLLPPVSLPASIGFKEMDVRNLGYGLPPTIEKNPATFYLKGPLLSPAANALLEELEAEAVPTPRFEEDFRALLNQADIHIDLEDNETLLPVSPPLYGQWHAARPRIQSQQDDNWFDRLNTDLSLRAVAGMGTQVVKEHQESLMAAAWDQLPGIEALNQELRQYQLSLEVSKCFYKKHIFPLAEEDAFRLTAAVHDKVRIDGGNISLSRTFSESPVPTSIFSPTFRRITRKSGPVFKRMRFHQLDDPQKKLLTARLYDKHIALAPPLEGVLLPPSAAEPDLGTARIASPPYTGSPPIISSLKTQLIEQLDPVQTISQPVQNRIELPDWLSWSGEDPRLPPLEPVMAAPVFPRPMYLDLRDLSQSWLLPGVEHIANNTISLLESNQDFIESFMVGLNHEMARELLWREYPTDQRGTYFRQFWDTAYYADLQGEGVQSAEDLQDIKPIHEWGNDPLGTNRPVTLPGEHMLVLLIRGELLYRYPNALVYAQRATLTADPPRQRTLAEEKRYPIFRGFIPPDIQFVGFELQEEEVRGRDNQTPEEQGWYFVMKEHPSEARFGLDLNEDSYGTPVQDWDDFSWNHLVDNSTDLDALQYIDLNEHQPTIETGDNMLWDANSTGGAHAAHIAHISFRKPFSVAIHGSDMLPPASV